MNLRHRRLAAAVGALAVSGGAVLAFAGTASADTTPGWETDPNAIGTITFYTSSGTVITGGSLTDSPVAAYAVASHAGRPGDTKASLYAYTPQEGVNPAAWTGEALSAGTYSPAADGTPTAVTAGGLPFVTGESGDEDISDYMSDVPNNLTDAGYQNLYELRVYTSGPGQLSDPDSYDRVDISVDTAAGTWSVVYPSATTPPPAPTLNGAVTISGTAKVGGAVKCNASFTGATTTTYAWKAGSTTVSAKQTLTIPASAYNKSLTCTATGTNSGGAAHGTSAAKKVAKGSALKATAKPKISGKAVKGKTLKVSHGTWSPSATKYLYKWTANGKAIKGATKSSFKLAKAEIGKKVGCTVTAEKTGYTDGVASTSTLKVKK
jgi:hypothetical protein